MVKKSLKSIFTDEELNEEKCGSTDWVYVIETKRCYHFTSSRKNSPMLRNYCIEIGGTGASINSPDEGEALRKILQLDPVSLFKTHR